MWACWPTAVASAASVVFLARGRLAVEATPPPPALGTPAAHAADQDLKACAAKLEDYTTRVFQALNEG